MTRYSLLLLAGLAATVGCGQSSAPSAPSTPPTSSARVYSTHFPLAEDPISENGNWINGQIVGLDWKNARSTPGLAFGTETGSGGYDDTVALLTGTWGPDQTVEATVYTVNQNDSISEEVELRLRSSLSPKRCTGYEVTFSARSSADAYISIVRWNGPLGDFTGLGIRSGRAYRISTGDVVKATIVGSTITAYVNGVQKLKVIDSTYSSGSPGMGFFLGRGGAPGMNSDFGFTSLRAWD